MFTKRTHNLPPLLTGIERVVLSSYVGRRSPEMTAVSVATFAENTTRDCNGSPRPLISI
jgi:hypothetical protein